MDDVGRQIGETKVSESDAVAAAGMAKLPRGQLAGLSDGLSFRQAVKEPLTLACPTGETEVPDQG